jgi:predicted O-methyltransferase YrrM
MKIVEYFRRVGRAPDRTVQLLDATVQGIDNQSRLLNEKLEQLIEGMNNQSRLLNDKLIAMIDRQNAQIELHKAEIAAIRAILTGDRGGIDLSTIQVPPVPAARPVPAGTTLETALAHLPLMIDAKTYNTSHPDYDSTLVRNFPGKIFNADKPCANAIYANLKQFATGDHVPDSAWSQILKDALEEASTVPHADQVFERRAYIENYLREITNAYQAHYAAGWVNLDDALFLYWLVRKLNPKIIVQTGVCNGLSSAFMMLGLVKNGPQGSLHVIDMPPVFNSKDPGWTIKGQVYGVVIPEGKSSGWMVPDAYRNRFEVWNGDAKDLLPKMVDKVNSIDLFYHDSDHTYDHMMFEFREAKRKLRPGGLIVGDDISWNASVWDFADQHGVPSYNFKGAVGVAFF